MLLRASGALWGRGLRNSHWGSLSDLSSPSQWGWGRGGRGNAQGISGDNRHLAVTRYAQAPGSESKQGAAETPLRRPWREEANSVSSGG